MNTSGTFTFLFTDIEGSTGLWEREPERMQLALARHDALVRAAIATHRGAVVKMTGDGVYAAFGDALDAIEATLALQLSLADPGATDGVPLRVRCGLHTGAVERRDNDFFGSAVNRTARIMGAAHGGQVIVSQVVVDRVAERLPSAVSLRELGVVRLADLARPERVYQLVHPQLRQEFPALRSLETTPNNLPQQVSSFIGRERELAEVRTLLGKNRLVTLLGVGGLGKTRLSLQVAADVLDDYPDGVWLVELAPQSDAQLVTLAVASVLGVKEEPGRPVIEALVKHVGDRQLLLILDNCEHLLLACADLATQLLHAGPQVKVLASSREPLHVRGEASYPLPPLSTPDSSCVLPLDALTRFEAVRLFVDRAVAAQPAFQVTPRNAPAVVAICQTLDGIPLAIELAAARVRALSVATIAERLSDRFRLLTGGDRTLPRQQTLQACIDWSYDLLSGSERALLRRLAVFAGGWTLDAAEAVGAGGDIQKPDVLDMATHLAEKSLVEREVEGERYAMLETVRQYALERLHESGEEDQARARHLDFYATFVEAAEPLLQGPDQAAWLARFDLERENILSAHAWCDHAGQGANRGLRMAASVQAYYFSRGLLELAYRVTVGALVRAGAQVRNLARCRALLAAGRLGYTTGRYRDAQAYLEEGISIAREIGEHGKAAFALGLLGAAALGQADRIAARRHLEEAIAVSRNMANKRSLLFALGALAELDRTEGNLHAAEPLYAETLELLRDDGDRGNIAICLLNMAMVSIGQATAGRDRHSADRARNILHEVLAIAGEIESRHLGQSGLDVCAGLAAFVRDWGCAARLHGAAQAQGEQMGIRRDPGDEEFIAPLMAEAQEVLGQTAFANAEAAGRAQSYDEAMAEARAWLKNSS